MNERTGLFMASCEKHDASLGRREKKTQILPYHLCRSHSMHIDMSYKILTGVAVCSGYYSPTKCAIASTLVQTKGCNFIHK